MSSRYVFRKAVPREAEAVFALVKRRIQWMDENGLHGWNTTDYAARYPLEYYVSILNDLFVLADTQNGSVVSAGALFESDERWNDPASALYLHNFVADPDVCGAGAMFLEHAEEYARKCGKEYMRLDSSQTNAALAAYYTSRGYTECGYCKDGPYNGVLRQKKL